MQEVDVREVSRRDRSHINPESLGTNGFTQISATDSDCQSKKVSRVSRIKEAKNDKNIDSELQNMFNNSTTPTRATRFESLHTQPTKNQPSITPVKEIQSESQKKLQSESNALNFGEKNTSHTDPIESAQTSLDAACVLTPATNKAVHTSPG